MDKIYLLMICLILLVLSGMFFVKARNRRRQELWGQRVSSLSSTEQGLPSTSTKKSADGFLKKQRLSESREDTLVQRDKDAVFAMWGLDLVRAPFHFHLLKVASTIVICSIYSFTDGAGLVDPNNNILWYGYLVIIGVFGFLAPEIIVAALAKRRREKIEKIAPDVIELLMLTVEAGVTFDAAVLAVCKSVKRYAGYMAQELEILSAELVILPNREMAYANLIERSGSKTFGYLKVALMQGEKYGTPIAASLRIVAKEGRQQALLAKEEKAGRLPVYLSIPLMLFILPPVVVISAGPGFVQLMRSF
ncbi:hypothetical protein A9Q83_01875 [Alphaproteobacteria bacterium 46_93_T64]|nr:hypothetical protein A9Q83_01875 [Alphaproteobacteria bacterium 46_93_T64]